MVVGITAAIADVRQQLGVPLPCARSAGARESHPARMFDRGFPHASPVGAPAGETPRCRRGWIGDEDPRAPGCVTAPTYVGRLSLLVTQQIEQRNIWCHEGSDTHR